MTELRMIRAQVRALPPDAPRVGFVATSFESGLSKLVVGDEFGLPTTSKRYTLEPLLRLLLREQALPGRSQAVPAIDYLPRNIITSPGDEPVIDVQGLRLSR